MGSGTKGYRPSVFPFHPGLGALDSGSLTPEVDLEGVGISPDSYQICRVIHSDGGTGPPDRESGHEARA